MLKKIIYVIYALVGVINLHICIKMRAFSQQAIRTSFCHYQLCCSENEN